LNGKIFYYFKPFQILTISVILVLLIINFNSWIGVIFLMRIVGKLPNIGKIQFLSKRLSVHNY